MEKMIRRTLSFDVALITIFIVLIWSTLLFNLHEIYCLFIDPAVFSVVAVACALCLIFLTSALLGVISHLRKNKAYLYAQEFSHLAKYRQLEIESEAEYEKQ